MVPQCPQMLNGDAHSACFAGGNLELRMRDARVDKSWSHEGIRRWVWGPRDSQLSGSTSAGWPRHGTELPGGSFSICDGRGAAATGGQLSVYRLEGFRLGKKTQTQLLSPQELPNKNCQVPPGPSSPAPRQSRETHCTPASPSRPIGVPGSWPGLLHTPAQAGQRREPGTRHTRPSLV